MVPRSTMVVFLQWSYWKGLEGHLKNDENIAKGNVHPRVECFHKSTSDHTIILGLEIVLDQWSSRVDEFIDKSEITYIKLQVKHNVTIRGII